MKTKVAIFHNLKSGGGLIQVKNIAYYLKKNNFEVKVFSPKRIMDPKNSLEALWISVSTTQKEEKYIAQKIIKGNYDHIFVFPCHITQTPHIIRFLPKHKTYYFFLEPKREFYEKTSFDYFSLKRILSRIVRFPIKIIDQINCKTCNRIIVNSVYSQYKLKKLYNKKSTVIYPGMKPIKPHKITIKNNHKFLSFGLLTMLKGHHISKQIINNVEIIGQISHEDIKIYLPKNTRVKTNTKIKPYKTYTFFLANQINEPFGLTTLEAASNNCFIFGRNEAGTSEIIKNGINGTLLPVNEISLSKKTIRNIDKKTNITLIKTCIINWNYTVNQILTVVQNA